MELQNADSMLDQYKMHPCMVISYFVHGTYFNAHTIMHEQGRMWKKPVEQQHGEEEKRFVHCKKCCPSKGDPHGNQK